MNFRHCWLRFKKHTWGIPTGDFDVMKKTCKVCGYWIWVDY